MKRITLMLIGIISIFASYGQSADSLWTKCSTDGIVFNTLNHNFGKVLTGDTYNFKFKIKNDTGNNLVIMHVTTSCGCTSTGWTEKPIGPQNEGVIKVKYEATETGTFNKSVFVYTNFNDKPIKLTISGTVIASKTETEITKRSTDFNKPIPGK